jgi:hypothetical protein
MESERGPRVLLGLSFWNVTSCSMKVSPSPQAPRVRGQTVSLRWTLQWRGVFFYRELSTAVAEVPGRQALVTGVAVVK